ncbi:hypothetical protein CFP56_006459 [Quercus suber]|uniref:Plant basic secretory protein (BSP) family protein n=1 Tax=Quercus suber TaxID=58331 RepID=A0AAW0LB22_QUESU
MANQMFFVSFLVTLALAIHGIHAVEYEVTNNAGNTPGGVRFNNEIGSDYSKQTLISATDFIWSLFKQSTDADRKNVPKVSLFIDDMDGVAYASNNEIHVSARYINGFSGDVKTEITGVLYHESTHIWQWNGNGQNTPGGLIEGIADYVRLKAGYAPSHWVQPGQGNSWDQGYDVTARFLDYCNIMVHHKFLLLSFVITLAAIQGIHAVSYVVTNTAANTTGGSRFNNEIGSTYSKQTLKNATNFTWKIFQQKTTADRKNVAKVSLFIEDIDGAAYAVNNEIHVSARYIASYSGDVKREITGVLFHEMTHIWQWSGNGQSPPGGLIEGIADFVRLKSGYVPSHWVQPGKGDRWDQGYDVNANTAAPNVPKMYNPNK